MNLRNEIQQGYDSLFEQVNSLEDIDDIAGSYRELAELAIDELQAVEEEAAVNYDKAGELRKKLEELKRVIIKPKYVVTPKGISAPIMTNTNTMGKGEVCKLLNKLEKENKRLRENWENLEKWVKGKKINFTGDDRFWRGYNDFHGDVRAKMEKLEGGE